MLLFLSIVCLAAAAYLAGELATVAGRQRQLSLRRASNYGVMRRLTGSSTERVKFNERVLGPAAMKLARIVLRLNPKTTVESVHAKLLRAGLSRRLTPTSFLAGKGVFALVGLVLGLMFAPSIGIGGGLFLTIAFAGVGFLLPDLFVSSRSKKRREAVKSEMPDALDLLAVSVEAGMGFDGAIAKLTEHMEGELADEFALMLNEIRIGEGRAEALKKMARRAQPPPGRRRGEGDEGADQDALPDGHLHLPGDVPRHPRPGLPQPGEVLLMAPQIGRDH